MPAQSLKDLTESALDQHSGCLFHHHEHVVLGCLLLVREESIHHRECVSIFYDVDREDLIEETWASLECSICVQTLFCKMVKVWLGAEKNYFTICSFFCKNEWLASECIGPITREVTSARVCGIGGATFFVLCRSLTSRKTRWAYLRDPVMPHCISAKLLLTLHELSFSSCLLLLLLVWHQHQVGDCVLLYKTTQSSHELSLLLDIGFCVFCISKTCVPLPTRILRYL